MPNFVTRLLGAVPWAAGTRQTLDIDRSGVLHQINLNISFDITGVAATAGPLNECLARIIQRLDVVINGQDTVCLISGELLASRARYEFGALPFGMDATVVVGAATTSYNIVIPLPFWLPRARRPDDTSLDLRRVRQCVLGITWQAQGLADFFTTPGVAATYQNVVCSVEGFYLDDAPEDKRYVARVLDMVSQDVGATNAALAVLQDRGEFLYRNWHIISVADRLALNTIINSIELVAGQYTFHKSSGIFKRAALIRDYGLPLAATFMPAPVGVYRVDTTIWGEMGTAIATGLLSADLFLKFDVTKQAGTNTLNISREAVRPLRV